MAEAVAHVRGVSAGARLAEEEQRGDNEAQHCAGEQQYDN
jgi:hypothetical protein